MLTWERGRALVTQRRVAMEGPLDTFVEWLKTAPLTQVEGTAVFLHPDKLTTPLALRENTTFNHVIHSRVLVVSATSANVPFVSDDERCTVDPLGDPYDAIDHLTVRFGFQEDQDVPAALALAHSSGLIELDLDNVYYFLSRINVQRGSGEGLSTWRKRLFIGMAHNAASPVEYFRLPEDRTVSMGAAVVI
jgi:KUP system potassium uptake protein